MAVTEGSPYGATFHGSQGDKRFKLCYDVTCVGIRVVRSGSHFQHLKFLPPHSYKCTSATPTTTATISGMDKLEDSWSFLQGKKPCGKLGILHILAISCCDCHTRSWVHGCNFKRTYIHTGLFLFTYSLTPFFPPQDDKFMFLMCFNESAGRRKLSII